MHIERHTTFCDAPESEACISVDGLYLDAHKAKDDGDHDLAYRLSMRALESARSVNCVRGQLRAMEVLGALAVRRGDLATARQIAEEKLALARVVHGRPECRFDRGVYGVSLYNYSLLEEFAGRGESSLRALIQAEEVLRKADHKGWPMTTGKLASFHLQLGSVRLAERIGSRLDPAGYTGALDPGMLACRHAELMAKIKYLEKEYGQAASYAQTALEYAHHLPPEQQKSGRLDLHIENSRALLQLADYEQAVYQAEMALGLAQERLDQRAMAMARHQLACAVGRHGAEGGDHERAVRLYIESLETDREIGYIDKVCRCYGVTLWEIGRRQEAIGFLEGELERIRGFENPAVMAQLLDDLVKYHEQTGALEKALSYSREHAKVLGDMDDEKGLTRLRMLQIQLEADTASDERSRAERLEQDLSLINAELLLQASSLAEQTEALTRFRRELRAILAGTSELREALRKVSEKLRELPSGNIDWTRFEADLNERFPRLRLNLSQQYPALTRAELRVCSLIALGLTTAVAARILGLSSRSVDTHRTNIRRKLGIGARDDLAVVLARIGNVAARDAAAPSRG